MRKSWASVTVGLLVLLVAGATYVIIRATSERTTGGKGIVVWGLFTDASGLFEKSRVQTAGISIGQIEKRELDPATAKAKISVRINPNIKLWSNAVVSKKSASLLGEYYLEIDPGTPYALVNGQRRDMVPLKDGDEIKDVREPTAMGDLMADIGTILPILKDILTDVKRLTSGTVTDIAENVNKLIETNASVLERLLNRVDHIAANVEGVTTSEAGDVKVAIQNVREITDSLKTLVGTSQGEVKETGTAVRGSLDKLQRTIDNLDRTLKNTESISSRIDKGEGTVGHLLTDDTIARNVEDITEDASTFVRSVTKLQTIVGLRFDANVISRSFKEYLQVQLEPRPDKFYLIELVQDPRGYRQATTTVTSSSQTGTTSQQQVTISQQLRFTLMFGKRIGPWAGRFGIKESTGGVGLDLHLLDDRLNFSLDVFDAQTNQYPRIKPTVALAVWKRNLFLLGGGDDLANFNRARGGAGGGIDWFLGTQLVFNDEDLKSLLLLGGGAAAGAASK
ncbi:MAG TPA: MlaD family protein [Polyangia bacterium]|nr:MlaD family protein [Polyangia bacterium]